MFLIDISNMEAPLRRMNAIFNGFLISGKPRSLHILTIYGKSKFVDSDFTSLHGK